MLSLVTGGFYCPLEEAAGKAVMCVCQREARGLMGRFLLITDPLE